jgi:hypothetical protein
MSDLKDPKYITEKAREIPVEVLAQYLLQTSKETVICIEKYITLIAIKKSGETHQSKIEYKKTMNNILKHHRKLIDGADILKNLIFDIEAKAWTNQTIN